VALLVGSSLTGNGSFALQELLYGEADITCLIEDLRE
jgi:hypothetical protein